MDPGLRDCGVSGGMRRPGLGLLEQELHLMFVAITRSKRDLIYVPSIKYLFHGYDDKNASIQVDDMDTTTTTPMKTMTERIAETEMRSNKRLCIDRENKHVLAMQVTNTYPNAALAILNLTDVPADGKTLKQLLNNRLDDADVDEDENKKKLVIAAAHEVKQYMYSVHAVNVSSSEGSQSSDA